MRLSFPFQEHHSNIVPWQLLQKRKDLTLKVIPVNDRGELELEKLQELLSPRTKIVAIPHVSNTLGTINPVKEIASLVQQHCDAVIIVDGAQAMAHLKVDVQDLGVDFYCFSAHKLFGPTGLGVLFGRKKWLDYMPPFMGGGDMIEHVSFTETTFAPCPQKFEAGTPHIAGSIGLGTAMEYLQSLGMEKHCIPRTRTNGVWKAKASGYFRTQAHRASYRTSAHFYLCP